MTYRISIGQNQWLRVEYIGIEQRASLYQVIESHRCPQVKDGDMIRQDRRNGMLTAYSDVNATRPRYRLPAFAHVEYEGYSEEE